MVSNKPKKQHHSRRRVDEIRSLPDLAEGFEMEDETRHPTQVSLGLQHRNPRVARREATLFPLDYQTDPRIIYLVDQMFKFRHILHQNATPELGEEMDEMDVTVATAVVHGIQEKLTIPVKPVTNRERMGVTLRDLIDEKAVIAAEIWFRMGPGGKIRAETPEPQELVVTMTGQTEHPVMHQRNRLQLMALNQR